MKNSSLQSLRTLFLPDLWDLLGRWFPGFYRSTFRRATGDSSRKSWPSSPISRKSWIGIAQTWEEGISLRENGHYRFGIGLQKVALSEAYLANGVELERHVPPFLSPWFASNMGHLGFLGLFMRAQNLGVIEPSRRTLLLGKVANLPVLESLQHGFQKGTITSFGLERSVRNGKIPSIWSDVQNMEVLQTENGFQDVMSLWDTVWQTPADAGPNPYQLEPEYIEKAQVALEGLGVDLSRPTVALHVREKQGENNDPRVAELASYFESIKFLTSKGYQVVRFGTSGLTPFPELTDFVDLCRGTVDNTKFDALLLSRSRFLVSTMSGPTAVAINMGTPTLITNTIAFGRNCLRGPLGTMSLPKRYWNVETKRELTLAEILRSPIAFSDRFFPSELKMPASRPNSEREILEATMDMVELDSKDFIYAPRTPSHLDELRRDLGAVSFGAVPPSFLDSNQEWSS